MKRTLSFLLPAAAMLLAACGGANDRPSFPDFQEMFVVTAVPSEINIPGKRFQQE